MRNITLQTLRDWDACSEGYDKIAKHVGENEIIDLNLALEVTSIPDVVWVLAHDPDKHRWLSFLADMIDLPGCEAAAQTIRDYRDSKIPIPDLETFAAGARADTKYAYAIYATARAATYTAAQASYAAYAAYAAADVSIGDKPRLVNLIRSYYQ